MQINAVNTNINSTSFRGVVIHNKNNFIKAGLCSAYELRSSDVYSLFKKKKDYDLIINANSKGLLSFKIKSVGQGIKGLFRNIAAPWISVDKKSFTTQSAEEYISKWHRK